MPEFSEYTVASRLFRDAAMAQEAAVIADLTASWILIEQAIEDDLLAMLARYEAKGTIAFSSLVRSAQYQALLGQMEAYINLFEVEWSPDLEALFREVGMLGSESSITMAALFGDEVPGVMASFAVLPTGAIENIIAQTRAGKPLAELLSAAYPLASDGLTEALKTQIALGINPRLIAKEASRLGLSQSLNHILLVSRDQSMRAFRTSSLQTYEQSGVVVGVRRISARLLTTCFMCIQLDGTFYTLDQAYDAELHSQDRCTFIPDVEGAKPLQWEPALDWFGGLDPSDQIEILGPGRQQLYADGMGLDQMFEVKPNAIWGPSPVPISIRDL